MKLAVFLTSLAALASVGVATPTDGTTSSGISTSFELPVPAPTKTTPGIVTPTTFLTHAMSSFPDGLPSCTSTLLIASNTPKHVTVTIFKETMTFTREVDCGGCTALAIQNLYESGTMVRITSTKTATALTTWSTTTKCSYSIDNGSRQTDTAYSLTKWGHEHSLTLLLPTSVGTAW